jgi:glutamine amidotransferase
MGWSRVKDLEHPVFEGITSGSYFYFVHSYRLEASPCGVATCEYGEPFTAAAAKDNYIGVQFHPEKSGVKGELLLKNFLEWKL